MAIYSACLERRLLEREAKEKDQLMEGVRGVDQDEGFHISSGETLQVFDQESEQWEWVRGVDKFLAEEGGMLKRKWSVV